jgi:hypothetical protein
MKITALIVVLLALAMATGSASSVKRVAAAVGEGAQVVATLHGVLAEAVQSLGAIGP